MEELAPAPRTLDVTNASDALLLLKNFCDSQFVKGGYTTTDGYNFQTAFNTLNAEIRPTPVAEIVSIQE